MKYIFGFLVSIAVVLIIVFLNNKVLINPINEFLKGWIGCLSYFLAKDLYAYHKKNRS